MLSNNLHFKQRDHYFYQFSTAHFTKKTDPSLAELNWIFIQKIIESVKLKYDAQIQACLFINNTVYLVAGFNNGKENYFNEELLQKLKITDDAILPEKL